MISVISVISVVVSIVMVVAISMIVSITMFVSIAMLVFGAMVLVMLHIYPVVPVVAHKMDRTAAGVILGAVLVPMLVVPRRHMKVDRLNVTR